jgi:hypothetical protein
VVSRFGALAMVGALAASTLVIGGSAPPVAAAPGDPLQLAGGPNLQIFGQVVKVGAARATFTFENDPAAVSDVWVESPGSFDVDPADLQPGAAVAADLVAAGVDPAQVVTNAGAVQFDSSTCQTAFVAPGGSCSVTVTKTASALPYAATIQLLNGATVVGSVVAVWPARPPSVVVNDHWADAIDVSTLAVPPFDGSFSGVGITGTTVGATIEAGEPEVIDGFGNPWPMGTVWYRYESPPGGFSGLLGYQMDDSSFIVTPYAADEPDPFNPFLGSYPDEGPGALDRMSYAPSYVVRRDLPGGASYEASVVRVEPGQKVWFQVVPNPLVPGAAPGPFTFELYHVDDVAERVGEAPEAYACGAACGPLSNFSAIGYADTWAASPQPQGPASSWTTFEVASPDVFAVTVSSQKASRRESPRPVNVAVYRAPSSSRVNDPADLGVPVASAAGGLVPRTTWLNGQWVSVDQWVTEVASLAVTRGRYYVRIAGDATFTQYHARLAASTVTPPTVTITSPPANAAYASASDVPALAFDCVPASGTIVSTTVTVDGTAVSATDPLPTTPGSHTVVVTCTESTGSSATASASYSVAAPLIVPDRTIVTPEDVAVSIDLVAPVVVAPGVTVTVESAGAASHGTVSAGSAGVTYTPAANYAGPDSFTYTLVASNGQRATATVYLTITTVNDAPVAVDDALAVDARSTLEIDLAALVGNDTDIDGGSLSVTSITRAAGTVTGRLTSCTGQRPACRLYVAPTSAGTESFDYVVSDGNGGTDTGRLTITVRPIALPDYLYLSMPCDNINVSGPTTGIRVTRAFGVVLVRGSAQIGSNAAVFNVIGFQSGGFAYGWVFTGTVGRWLIPQSISNPIGDTWIITGTYRIGRLVCPFQINVRDGG